MKIKIEGWVLLKHRGQMRFSAVHDTVTKQTYFGPGTQNTGFVFETDLGQPTVENYTLVGNGRNSDDPFVNFRSHHYHAKKELVENLTDHYIVRRAGPEWVNSAIDKQRQFNIYEESLEHEDFGKFDFFFYIDPVKD